MKLDNKTIGKIDENPIFKGLPDGLKDPKVYKKIEKELFDVLDSDHVHKKPAEWMKCDECQGKLQERREILKKLGFKSFAQFLEWRKVMDVLVNHKDIKI